MTWGPIFGRELIVASRRRSTYVGRAVGVVVLAVVVGATVALWDWSGRDRASVAGAASLGVWAFSLALALQAAITLGTVPGEVAAGIALERDRKTLDALLATRLSSAEVVAGALASGLLRYAAGMAALLPLVVLITTLGGIDPRVVWLAAAGFASTAFFLAAVAVSASAVARTAQRAVRGAASLAIAWACLPFFAVIALPRAWPAGAEWLVPPALWLLDSSPLAVVAHLIGVIRRTATPLDAVLRMISLQAAGGLALVGWAVFRLRPASRAVYDGEGRASLLRSLRHRRRPRPSCGDDPVFWNEKYSTRGTTAGERLSGRLIGLLVLGLFGYLTSFFAWPALKELAALGYGPAPEGAGPLELNPLARVIVTLAGRAKLAPQPGLARLEFNVFLRQVTAVFDFVCLVMLAGLAAEGVAAERERDTWLGLIATPLTGREILRAKMLGAVWRARGVLIMMAGLWTLGLVTGAVHPLGFAAAVVGLAASTWCAVAFGSLVSLWSGDRKHANGLTLPPALLLPLSGLAFLGLPARVATLWVEVGSMPFLTWATLLSYDDVRAAARSGALPPLGDLGMTTGEGVGTVAAVWLVAVAAQAAGAYLFSRLAFRGFDAAVGRPVRTGTAPPPVAPPVSPARASRAAFD